MYNQLHMCFPFVQLYAMGLGVFFIIQNIKRMCNQRSQYNRIGLVAPWRTIPDKPLPLPSPHKRTAVHSSVPLPCLSLRLGSLTLCWSCITSAHVKDTGEANEVLLPKYSWPHWPRRVSVYYALESTEREGIKWGRRERAVPSGSVLWSLLGVHVCCETMSQCIFDAARGRGPAVLSSPTPSLTE